MPSDAKWCQKNTSATPCFSDQCTWSLDRLIWEKSKQHDLLSILSPPKHTLKVRQASLPPWEFNLPLYFVLCIQKICLGYSHDQNPCILHIHKYKHFQHKPQPKLSKALERFTSHLLLSFIQWREEIKGSRFSNDKKSNKRQCHIYVTRSMMSHKRQQACWHCYAIWWQKGWYNKKGEVKERVMPQKRQCCKMVEVSKKGNVEKGVALQKKGEAAKWQFWKTSWCHSWSTITLLPSSFEAFAFPHQITFHKDLNLFTVILSSWLSLFCHSDHLENSGCFLMTSLRVASTAAMVSSLVPTSLWGFPLGNFCTRSRIAYFPAKEDRF